MAWALTIHKSQGLTIEISMVDIGKREWHGLRFTSISRVKSIDGLHISPPFSYEWYEKMENNPYVTIKKKKRTTIKFFIDESYTSIEYLYQNIFLQFLVS